jgi:hypothetical protein
MSRWIAFALFQPVAVVIWSIPPLAMVDWHPTGTPLPWYAVSWMVTFGTMHAAVNAAFIIMEDRRGQ